LESLTLQDHKNFISYIYYLESEQWICTASNDATICIYQQDGFVPLLTLKGHGSTVCALAEGLAPRSLISGSWDKTARVWSISEAGDVTFIALEGHEAAVWAVATLKEQGKYVTGGADKNIYYWNAKGEKLRLLKGRCCSVCRAHAAVYYRGEVPRGNGQSGCCSTPSQKQIPRIGKY